ncbi:MerR family transcriptional regulator [Bacillus sp. FSL L8-0152]|uniref:MerR family transcriptional regulator n=1 Tax=Bacillus sp. FSL L8-0152 TaxID=2921516 RepID=UPI0030F56DC2
MNDIQMKKGEIAKVFGITKETLRFYEDKGLIQPNIEKNNYRNYGNQELKHLIQILFYKEIGLSIEEISSIMKKKEMNITGILERKYSQMEMKVDQLVKMKNKLQRTLSLIKNRIPQLNSIQEIYYQERKSYCIDLKENLEVFQYFISKYPMKQLLPTEGIFDVYPIENLDKTISDGIPQKAYYPVGSEHLIEDVDIVTFPAGKYLNLDFLTTEDNYQTDKKKMYDLIKEYMKENKLQLKISQIFENDTMEIDMVLKNNELVCNIQVLVEKQGSVAKMSKQS